MVEPRPLRVLVVNQYFPPDTSATARIAADVTAAIGAAGHTVQVLAGRPSYDPLERRGWRPLRRDESVAGADVERVGSTAFSRQAMLGRAANYVSYLCLALLRGLTLRSDLVLSMTDPPLASVVAALIAKARRAAFVYNIRDLHPDMAVASGLVGFRPLVSLWERMHRWSLRRADLVIVLGEDMRRRILEKGVELGRVVVVRDGAQRPMELPPRDHPVSVEVRSGFDFVVLHAGNIGFAGAWDTLASAFRRIGAEKLGLVFVGEGAAAEKLKRLVAGQPNVRVMPFRPAEQVPLVLQAGDLHVVTVRRGLEGLVVPSKLYPILAAGRPVLAVAAEASDVAQIVREAGCGWVADPDDPQAVAAAIHQAHGDPAELEARGRRARDAAASFARPLLLDEFVRELEKAARG